MIVAGFGFRAAATLESLRDAFDQAVGDQTVDALATLEDKAQQDAFCALQSQLNLPVHAVPEAALAHVSTATHSPQAQAARGTGSVAEATALSAAGPGATLLCTRVISRDRMATCALAQSRMEGGAS